MYSIANLVTHVTYIHVVVIPCNRNNFINVNRNNNYLLKKFVSESGNKNHIKKYHSQIMIYMYILSCL